MFICILSYITVLYKLHFIVVVGVRLNTLCLSDLHLSMHSWKSGDTRKGTVCILLYTFSERAKKKLVYMPFTLHVRKWLPDVQAVLPLTNYINIHYSRRKKQEADFTVENMLRFYIKKIPFLNTRWH